MIRVADYIMQKLAENQVNQLYMVTGRGVLFLSDAAAKCKGLDCVSMHHEQACAYAAYASASYNQTMGACLVSTGCASTNAITGLLCAWQDDVPVVFISGQNTLRETTRHSGDKIKTWGQQEADIISIVNPLTKYAVMLASPDDAVYEIDKAFYLASNGRKGPVWIDIPIDIQNMRIDTETVRHFIPDSNEKKVSFDTSVIQEVICDIEKSKRPVILFGSGIKNAGAEKILLDFINASRIPVAYSASAPDVIGYDHPLCMGSLGMMACRRSAAFAVQNSDLLLVIGNRLSPMTTGSEYTKFAREAKIIVVDIDENEHQKNTVRIDRFIHSDAKDFIEAMLRFDVHYDDSVWTDRCQHWKEVFPVFEERNADDTKTDLYYLSQVLSDRLPSDAILITDAGLEELILPSNICFSDNRRCIHPSSQGAMGFALPAAVGAYLESNKCVVAVIGDGSVMMNIQELATIAYKKLPVKIIVVNNGLYAVIRKRQKELFRTRTIGTDDENGVGPTDFKRLAKCYDLRYYRADRSAELKQVLDEVIADQQPLIFEIKGLENQEYISTAYARTKDRKFVHRPLEDQAPFLDREVFLSEMIIDPIDQ